MPTQSENPSSGGIGSWSSLPPAPAENSMHASATVQQQPTVVLMPLHVRQEVYPMLMGLAMGFGIVPVLLLIFALEGHYYTGKFFGSIPPGCSNESKIVAEQLSKKVDFKVECEEYHSDESYEYCQLRIRYAERLKERLHAHVPSTCPNKWLVLTALYVVPVTWGASIIGYIVLIIFKRRNENVLKLGSLVPLVAAAIFLICSVLLLLFIMWLTTSRYWCPNKEQLVKDQMPELFYSLNKENFGLENELPLTRRKITGTRNQGADQNCHVYNVQLFAPWKILSAMLLMMLVAVLYMSAGMSMLKSVKERMAIAARGNSIKPPPPDMPSLHQLQQFPVPQSISTVPFSENPSAQDVPSSSP